VALHGIDVSNVNGLVDWPRIAREGISFAYIKATEGVTFDDKRYELNRKGAAKAGIAAGAYHFARPGNNTPEDEAAHFLSRATPRLGELVPALDLEHNAKYPRDRAVPVPKRIQWVRRWLQLVEKEIGMRPVVYLNPDYGNNALRGGDFSAFPLWLAHYAPKPAVPGAWKNYAVWQHDDHGKVAGKKVDVNIATEGAIRALKFGGEPMDAIKNGHLIRASGRKQVFLIDGGKRRAIPDRATFLSKWHWADVRSVPQKVVNGFPEGKPFPALDDPIRNGDLVRAAGAKSTYVVERQQRRAIPGPATFLAKWEWYQVRVLEPQLVNAVPLGRPFPAV
jgi:GH25 family lysozyme M1 (1,4-beta-N-acetylmuramidase)